MVIVTEPVLLLRALKSSELACLLALTLAGEPVRVSWLGRVTGLSPHTLTSALNTLQALGLAQDDGQRSGWHLIASLQENLLARAEALPAKGECQGSSPPGAGSRSASPACSGTPPSSNGTQNPPIAQPIAQAATGDSAGIEPVLGSADASEYRPNGAAQGEAIRDMANCSTLLNCIVDQGAIGESALSRDAAIRGTAIRDSLLEEVEGYELDSPPDLDSATSGRDLPSEEILVASPAKIERILAATARLFGEPVHGPPGRYPDLRRLLATIAHVHSRRQGLRKPARVVYSMLRDGIPPPDHLLTDPLAYLPADFLQAAGLPVPERGAGVQAGGWAEEADLGVDEGSYFAHSHFSELETQHPSLSLPVLAGAGREPSGPCAVDAWKMAVEVLRDEMPRQAFEEHLRPACLLRFEPGGFSQAGGYSQAGGCLFTVQAEDAYSRDWLTQRARRSLGRILEGICQGPARVEFVAPP